MYSLRRSATFFGNKHNLGLPAIFGVLQKQFSIIDILCAKLEDLTNPHPFPVHQFQHQPVSWVIRFENDLINNVFWAQSFTTCRVFSIDFLLCLGSAAFLQRRIFDLDFCNGRVSRRNRPCLTGKIIPMPSFTYSLATLL